MSIAGGGAERVLATVSSGLADRGQDVTIISGDPLDNASFYPLAPTVKRVALCAGTGKDHSRLWEALRRVRMLRRRILDLEPDVVVAFMHSSYVPVGIALAGAGIPVVASEHIGPEHYRTRLLQKALVMLTPFTAQKITVVSEQVRQQYWRWLRRRMIVAPNPLVAPPPSEERLRPREKTVLSVGTLRAQKNHSCLIAAFALVASDFPDWTLRIVGEGELRKSLEGQIRELGLERRVELPGAIGDIWDEYRRASLFVSPSTYESFGLATAEALLTGVPAIAFEDCHGTNILIRNNINGVLVDGSGDRIEALSMALRKLMAAPDEIERLSDVDDPQLDAYGLSAVLDTWEGILWDAAWGRSFNSMDHVRMPSSAPPTESERK